MGNYLFEASKLHKTRSTTFTYAFALHLHIKNIPNMLYCNHIHGSWTFNVIVFVAFLLVAFPVLFCDYFLSEIASGVLFLHCCLVEWELFLIMWFVNVRHNSMWFRVAFVLLQRHSMQKKSRQNHSASRNVCTELSWILCVLCKVLQVLFYQSDQTDMMLRTDWSK